MAVTRATPSGWLQETTTTVTRATPSGWVQESTAAAASVTVSPSAGTLRLAGQSPTVAQTWSVAPTAGTLRLVGQAPTVESWWFSQALYPTAVALTGLTGAYTDIDEDPSTPDDNWLLAA